MPCALCGGRGYMMNPPGWNFGEKIPCLSCDPGASFVAQRGAPSAPGLVPPETAAPPTGEPWTPTQTAQVLKAALYIVVGLTVYGLYYLGIRAESAEADVLESDTSAPNGDDYSTWEPAE
jgi:hypothetical protein